MINWYLNGKKIENFDIKKYTENKKVILVGADIKRNEKLFQVMGNKNIICIFDNNKKIWGMKQEGIPIVKPYEKKEEIVMISGVHDWKTISNQMEQLGYSQIYFFLTSEVEMAVSKCLLKFSPSVYDNKIHCDKIYKYVHFIPDEKFFASVIEYIEYGLNILEHFFVIYNVNVGNRNDIYKIWNKYIELSSKYHNIFLCSDDSYRLNLFDWDDNERKLEGLVKKTEKIIFHGEFLAQRIFDFFLNKIHLIKIKGVFIPWGGDIGKNEYTNLIIKGVLQYARLITYSYSIDRETIIKCFPATQNAIWVKLGVSYARLTKCAFREKGIINNILIAHSAHDYTKAMETIEYLSDIKEKINLYCITSYGPQNMAKKISSYGEKCFGKQFITIKEYMNYKEYVDFLSCIDIAVFGMEFLSGRDTLELLFWIGAKVYLKPDSVASKCMKATGYKINNYYMLKSDLKNELFENKDREWNQNIASNEFDSEKKLKQWKKLYEYDFNVSKNGSIDI